MPIPGAVLIDPAPVEDDRGSFVRLYSREAFEPLGMSADFDYCAVSSNRQTGTLRGLHFQAPPHEESKLIWCLRGSVFDVIVDLRPESTTYRRWSSVELRPEGPLLFVPKGVAHGFQTLEDDSVLQYHIAGAYRPASSSGVHWNDRTLSIPWPIRPPSVVSPRDDALPRL
jgi:dTDP-4-dehydrorhamnose 3,5-epimerase